VHQEEQRELSDFFLDNFFERIREGYTHDPASGAGGYSDRFPVDAQGLHWTQDEQFYIPDWDHLRFECFEAVHKHPFSGHFGGQRTQAKASQLFYWPNLARDIQAWVNACDSCQRVKAVRRAPVGELHPLEIPGRRWASISMDLITDLPTTPLGHDSIWVCVDRLTKMVYLKAVIKTVTAPELARIFIDEVFRLHGLPDNIVSDSDPRLTASFWSQLHKLLKVQLNMSTRDHPQSDGQTENANDILEDTFRHFVGPYHRDWDQYLAVVEFAMNNAYHSGIRTAPFMLNYGQHPQCPVLAKLRAKNPAVSKFLGNWDEQLSKAKTFYALAQERYKHYADEGRKPAPDYKP
jgi:hypothetical protein